MAAVQINKALFRSLNSFIQLKNVHAHIFRFHLYRHTYIINLVIKSAFHFNRPDYAKAVLRAAQPNSFHLYHSMIRGFVSQNYFEDAINFFHVMRRERCSVNNFIYSFVLKCCSHKMDIGYGASVHSLIVKEGFELDSDVDAALVGMYAKLGCLGDARKVFDEMPEQNVVSWTAMISGYISARRFREAIDLYTESLETGLKPDRQSLVRVLCACSKLRDLVAGEAIHRYLVESGMERNVYVNNCLVDLYAKCGNVEKARAVFDEMQLKDIVSWSVMLQGYAANGFAKEALEVFAMMQRENLGLDRYLIVGVLSACASLGALEVGKWACSMMGRNEFRCNPVIGTALVDMYAKCGEIALAWEAFKEIQTRDIVVFNAVISSLAMAGHARTAFACFGMVQKCGWKANENTFLGLLCACSHAGLVDDGRRFFHGMSDVYALRPAIEHYGSMVDLLARAGLLNEAHDMILSMPMKANSVVWGALLAGCRMHKNTSLAECILKRLIELEPWNSGNYVQLSNIYAANRKWKESERIRSVMHEKGIQKVRGGSWIEVDGVVHEFLVGDTYHAMSDDIYGKLTELTKVIRAAGFAPAMEYGILDIEETGKKEEKTKKDKMKKKKKKKKNRKKKKDKMKEEKKKEKEEKEKLALLIDVLS